MTDDSPAPASQIVVRRADRLPPDVVDTLAGILTACVAEGASLGFLAPLAPDAARHWWAAFPRDGAMLLVAEVDGRFVGTVQLHDAESENGAHRGEVAKLLVHPAWRRRGIARALMTRLEAEARAAGKCLLVLDTREGDPSNDLYRALGYREAGRIPGWARNAAGTFSATVFWYKPLA
ncbi:MAG TPA: GNAT family N-acetyltransferase [Thermomicrobiaceae bacterium]|nr:GNAT family N-acetyltransferase [Thermomicrobiaceae bacterium]